MGLARVLSEQATSDTSAGCGTQGWRAPEIVLSSDEDSRSHDDGMEPRDPWQKSKRGRVRISRKSDMWSLGCVIYFILSNGKHPYGGMV
jgi:serine/threonine-protein kinase/endoribonuclease IRE1